jgi:transposase-like protein
MNIVERGRVFVQWLVELAGRGMWEWKQCPHCGSRLTIKNGSYRRRPWRLAGRQEVRVQRHLCHECGRTYGEQSALLVRGSWYGREVHRAAIDHWQHLGTSLRRTAEVMRSWLGRQERYLMWCPLAEAPPQSQSERCYLSASTVHRWLDRAGQAAQASVPGQLDGVEQSGLLGTDGLWMRLRGGAKRVVLLLTDSVSGVVWPPVVVQGEESLPPWQRLFERAYQAGLAPAELRGVTSDGAKGILSFLRRHLPWVQHQRCVWHLLRNLAGMVAEAAATAAREMGEAAREQVRAELTALIHGIIHAQSYEQAETALVTLLSHPQGSAIGRFLNEQFDRILVHLVAYYQGLHRVTPEWCWRDFRLRLSHGRNHRSDTRAERAALVWAIYRNFEPAQFRSERKRHYRHPGLSPLHVAGVPPNRISYLDALGV